MVIKIHPVRGLVFNALPQRLELFTQEHSLIQFYRFPLAAVFDVKAARYLFQGCLNLL